MTKRKLGVLLAGHRGRIGDRHGRSVRGRQRQRFQDRCRLSMLTPVMAGVGVTPLLTVGDVLPSGLSLRGHPRRDLPAHASGQGRVDLFVNHETSKVPFPYVTADAYRRQRGERLRQLAGEQADPQPALRGRAQRLVRHLEQLRLPAVLLQLPGDGEGGVRPGDPLHERGVARLRTPPGGRPGRLRSGARSEREAGLVVALDVKTGKHHPIHGMGRHNHENNVAIPGFGQPVVFSGDDTFTSGPRLSQPEATLPAGAVPAQSQLYSYIAPSTDALLADEGKLWAFVSDNAVVSTTTTTSLLRFGHR